MTLSYCFHSRWTLVKVATLLIFVLVNVVLYWQSKVAVVATIFPQQSLVSHEKNLSSGNNTLFNSTRLQLINFIPANSMLNLTKSNSYNFREKPLEKPSLRYTDKPFFNEEVINRHDFGYVIAPRVNCFTRKVEILICVAISYGNFKGRTVIRDTWGSYAFNKSNNAYLVFFIGTAQETSNKSLDSSIQRSLFQESSKYGDILQVDFIDSYRNLSIKSVSILKWASVVCPESKFVLKADDDMYINIPLLVKILRKQVEDSSTPSAFVIGSLQVGARPIRSKESKWYTPLSLFKEDIYPNYVSGTAYAMTNEAAYLLYEASLRLPLFWLEDIYITGLCSRKAGVRVFNNGYFTYGKPSASGCTFRNQISGHRYTHSEILQIHNQLYDPNLKC